MPPSQRRTPASAPALVAPFDTDPQHRGPLEQAAFLELAAVGRQDTMLGLLVLRLCRELDTGRSQTAALAAPLLKARLAALEGASSLAAREWPFGDT